MRFGLGLPIFANPGVPYFRTPNLEELRWGTVSESVQLAEALGLDSIWVADHMFLGRDGAILEGWTTLSAIAGMTSRIRLGPIHLGNGFRDPALTAKMVATLDVISGGRLELFVDPGWRAREHIAYGFDWRAEPAERVARLREALEICDLLWTGRQVSYQGEHYAIRDAICNPQPVRAGGPRVWLGEADDAILDLIADRADVWNSIPASLEALTAKIAAVDGACERHGRDPRTLAKTLETQVLVYRHPAERDALFERFAALRSAFPDGGAMADIDENLRRIDPGLDPGSGVEAFLDDWVIGTVDEVTDRFAAYANLGIEETICWFMDYPDTSSLGLLATEVAPRLRPRP